MNVLIDILLTLLFSVIVISFSVGITSLANLAILNSWYVSGKKPTYWDAVKKTIKELSSPFVMTFKSIKTKDKSVDVFPNVIMAIMMTFVMFAVFISMYGHVHLH